MLGARNYVIPCFGSMMAYHGYALNPFYHRTAWIKMERSSYIAHAVLIARVICLQSEKSIEFIEILKSY